MQRRHNCSPAASFANCVMTLYLLKVHLQTFLSIPIIKKCQILSCDTFVANERYAVSPPRIYASYALSGCRSQWPRGLRGWSAAARLLILWVRIPPGTWKFVCCECCMLLSRGLCDELITRPEESYRLWCVVVCDLETS